MFLPEVSGYVLKGLFSALSAMTYKVATKNTNVYVKCSLF